MATNNGDHKSKINNTSTFLFLTTSAAATTFFYANDGAVTKNSLSLMPIPTNNPIEKEPAMDCPIIEVEDQVERKHTGQVKAKCRKESPGHEDDRGLAEGDDKGQASRHDPNGNGGDGETTVVEIYDRGSVRCEEGPPRVLGWGCRLRHRLCRIEEMPDYLQFNKYVHTRYRCLHSAWDALLSIFNPLHNEFVNIHTHLTPMIYCLVYWEYLFPWAEVEDYPYLKLLGISHVICCVIPLAGSTIYHTFMSCRHGGEKRYRALLQFDMFGIWVTQSFGGLTNVIVSGWCLSTPAFIAYLGLYLLASGWALKQCLTANTPMRRRTSFALCILVRFVGVGFRMAGWGGGFEGALVPIILQDVVAIAGGLIGASLFPERLFPGRFDYILNSHNVLHISGVLALYFMNKATNADALWLIENLQAPTCRRPF